MPWKAMREWFNKMQGFNSEVPRTFARKPNMGKTSGTKRFPIWLQLQKPFGVVRRRELD